MQGEIYEIQNGTKIFALSFIDLLIGGLFFIVLT